MHVNVHAGAQVCMCTCACVCICICMHMSVCLCLWVQYMCAHARMCAHLYLHVHTHAVCACIRVHPHAQPQAHNYASCVHTCTCPPTSGLTCGCAPSRRPLLAGASMRGVAGRWWGACRPLVGMLPLAASVFVWWWWWLLLLVALERLAGVGHVAVLVHVGYLVLPVFGSVHNRGTAPRVGASGSRPGAAPHGEVGGRVGGRALPRLRRRLGRARWAPRARRPLCCLSPPPSSVCCGVPLLWATLAPATCPPSPAPPVCTSVDRFSLFYSLNFFFYFLT